VENIQACDYLQSFDFMRPIHTTLWLECEHSIECKTNPLGLSCLLIAWASNSLHRPIRHAGYRLEQFCDLGTVSFEVSSRIGLSG